MSKHTISHASQILAGDGVAFNLGDNIFGMGDELANSLRGIRIAVLVTEFFDPGDVGNAIIAASQTPAAGTADQDLDIDGSGVVDGVGILSFCGRVSITAAANESARTFTILGRDANGRPQAEEIAGPNTTTSEGVKHFTKIDRVIVDAEKVDDASAMKIARDIAKQIEQDMTYPGEVKVTLLREVRAIEYAR